jgi:CheY-like chemotaxis protein
MAKAKKTILIAEDEEYNMMYMEELFSNTLFDIIGAGDGQEAINLFKQHTEIDLVLMDIKMPKVGGVEAMKAIKILNSEMPVIALSAVAMDFEDESLLERGFDAYLSKPIDRAKLFELINKNIYK